MGTSKKAMLKIRGILPILDEKKTKKANHKEDAKFVQELCQLYGKKKKKPEEVYKKAKRTGVPEGNYLKRETKPERIVRGTGTHARPHHIVNLCDPF